MKSLLIQPIELSVRLAVLLLFTSLGQLSTSPGQSALYGISLWLPVLADLDDGPRPSNLGFFHVFEEIMLADASANWNKSIIDTFEIDSSDTVNSTVNFFAQQ